MSGAVAASAAALALYYFLKGRSLTSCQVRPNDEDAPPLVLEACRDVEHAPNNWMEALHYFKEVFKLMYAETLGRWHTVDLFVGLAYLSHKEQSVWPATDIARKGRRVNLKGSRQANRQLLEELAEIRRYMLYCRGLKFKKSDMQARFWIEQTGIDPSQILVQHATAGLLRPAYVLIRDDELKKVVLCIRGTQSMKDLFTSLTGATKPHHVVTPDGVTLGYSHLGMLAGARWLLRQAMPQLKQALSAAGPDYQLRVVGHSMGAGTAVMLTMMIRDLGPQLTDTKCIAIACPACMTLELANSCKGFVTSVVNGTDIVPTFCAASVDALREDVTASSWFVEFQRDLRASVMRAVQGGVRGLGSATIWTARNILTPAALPLTACYTRTAATCGPAVGLAAGPNGEPFFLPPENPTARAVRHGVPYPTDRTSGLQPTVAVPVNGQQLPMSFIAGSAHGQRHNREASFTFPVTVPVAMDVDDGDDGIGDVGAPGLHSTLSESTLQQTFQSCLYAAQTSQLGGTQSPRLASALQLLHDGVEVAARGSSSGQVLGVDSASPLSPRTPRSRSAAQMLVPEPETSGGQGRVVLRRRLWPWGTPQQAAETADELQPLTGNMGVQGEGLAADDGSGLTSKSSDSRGLGKAGRPGNGWGAGLWSWMGWGPGTQDTASPSMAEESLAYDGTPTVSRLSQLAKAVQCDGTLGQGAGLDVQGPKELSGSSLSFGHMHDGVQGIPGQPVIVTQPGQKMPGWLGGVFNACVTPGQRLRNGSGSGGPGTGDGVEGSGMGIVGSPGDDDEELLGDADLMMDTAGGMAQPATCRAGAGGSVLGTDAALRQQLQAGISAVVAAVTHEAEEDWSGESNGVNQEAERVLREAGDVSRGPSSPMQASGPPGRSVASIQQAEAGSAAVGGSEGGQRVGGGDAPVSGVWRPRSWSSSGAAKGAAQPVADASGLRARGNAARAAVAAAAEQAGMMEINVDGHLLQAPSAPGFVGAAAASSASGAGGTTASAPRHTHKRLYPAGRILHFVPLHALEPSAGLDDPNGLPTPSVPSASSGSLAPVVPADMPHRTDQQEPLGAPTVNSNTAPGAPPQQHQQSGTWVLLEVEDPSAYGRVKLCRTMVMDHFVSSYLVGLDSVMAQLVEQSEGLT